MSLGHAYQHADAGVKNHFCLQFRVAAKWWCMSVLRRVSPEKIHALRAIATFRVYERGFIRGLSK
jgi:hypothetical protein